MHVYQSLAATFAVLSVKELSRLPFKILNGIGSKYH